jgi:hypothetical protein
MYVHEWHEIPLIQFENLWYDLPIKSTNLDKIKIVDYDFTLIYILFTYFLDLFGWILNLHNMNMLLSCQFGKYCCLLIGEIWVSDVSEALNPK